MKGTDKSVDNIQSLGDSIGTLGTGWHVTSHTAKDLVLGGGQRLWDW